MKILIACEESQAVTIEMRKLGHEAYSKRTCLWLKGLPPLFPTEIARAMAEQWAGGWKVSDPKTIPFKFSNEMEDWEYHG